MLRLTERKPKAAFRMGDHPPRERSARSLSALSGTAGTGKVVNSERPAPLLSKESKNRESVEARIFTRMAGISRRPDAEPIQQIGFFLLPLLDKEMGLARSLCLFVQIAPLFRFRPFLFRRRGRILGAGGLGQGHET